MKSFSPSGSPGVDSLIKAARMLIEQPEIASTLEFDRHVEELQAFRRNLEKTFKDSLRLSPRTPLLQNLEPRFEQEFERFRNGGRLLEAYLADRSVADLESGCEEIHAAVMSLSQLAGQLRAQEDGWKQQYGEGLAGELKFLLDQTIKGHIPFQQASQALEKTLEACKGLEKALDQARPETETVAEDLAQCREELGSFVRALQRAVQSLRMQHEWEFEERLHDLMEGAETLARVHRQLMGSLYPPTLCPKCGLQQPADRPTCSACGARLPLAPPVSSAPPPPSSEARPRFGSFVDVETRVQQALENRVVADSLLQAIEGFMQRMRMGRQQFTQDKSMTDEHRREMTEAAERTEKALLTLRSDLRREDWEAVVESLDALLSVEEQMLEMQQKHEEALHSMPNS